MDPDSGLCIVEVIPDAGVESGAPSLEDAGVPACNANPDPCCRAPDGSSCEAGVGPPTEPQ